MVKITLKDKHHYFRKYVRGCTYCESCEDICEQNNNEKDVFFKCEKNGQIKIRYSEPKPKKCIGVIFDVSILDIIEILQAKNFKGLRRDSPFSKRGEWELKTKTDTFKVDGGDLVVIDDDEKIIDCLKHGINTINICLNDEYRIKKEAL